MSAESLRPGDEGLPSKPKRRQFVRSATAERLAPDAAARQGRVITLALQAFGERDRVIAFINTHDHGLGGRPLDLAIAGASGLAAVAGVMADRARLAPAASSPVHRLPIDEPSGAPDRGMAACDPDLVREEN